MNVIEKLKNIYNNLQNMLKLLLKKKTRVQE